MRFLDKGESYVLIDGTCVPLAEHTLVACMLPCSLYSHVVYLICCFFSSILCKKREREIVNAEVLCGVLPVVVDSEQLC